LARNEGIQLPESSRSPVLLSTRETLPECLVLSLAGSIDEKSAEQSRARPGGRTEPGIPANGPGNGADPGTRSGASQCALLGWGHIGAGSKQYSGSPKQQQLLHSVPRSGRFQRDGGHG
jgi:hypothetical protein